MDIKLIHDFANIYRLEINGVKLQTELHYNEANLIKDYLEENASVLREAVLRKPQ